MCYFLGRQLCLIVFSLAGVLLFVPLTLVVMLLMTIVLAWGPVFYSWTVVARTDHYTCEVKPFLWIGSFFMYIFFVLTTIMNSVLIGVNVGCYMGQDDGDINQSTGQEIGVCELWGMWINNSYTFLTVTSYANLDYYLQPCPHEPFSICRCAVPLIMFILFWIVGVLCMALDIVAFLIIYLIWLPGMIAFGLCRGCKEMQDAHKEYNNTVKEKGRNSCAACCADIKMSCMCCYTIFFAFFWPLGCILGLALAPIFGIFRSWNATLLVWNRYSFPESMKGAWDARGILWNNYWRSCRAIASKDFEESQERIPAANQNAQPNIQPIYQQQQPNYQPAQNVNSGNRGLWNVITNNAYSIGIIGQNDLRNYGQNHHTRPNASAPPLENQGVPVNMDAIHAANQAEQYNQVQPNYQNQAPQQHQQQQPQYQQQQYQQQQQQYQPPQQQYQAPAANTGQQYGKPVDPEDPRYQEKTAYSKASAAAGLGWGMLKGAASYFAKNNNQPNAKTNL